MDRAIANISNKFPQNNDAHLSFYDMYGIERLLNFVGFSVKKKKTAFIYLPLLKPLFYHRVSPEGFFPAHCAVSHSIAEIFDNF